MDLKAKDKRDNRDPEQIGNAIQQLRNLGMTTLQAADYVNSEVTTIHYEANGSVTNDERRGTTAEN